MALLFANNASGTLSTTLTVGSTSAVLQAGEGALFPSPSGGDTFYATLEDSSGNIEIVSCTARSSDTLTIVRAQEGTSAQEFASGSRFEIRVTAATLSALLQSAAASATYAPLSHFNDSSTNAQLLDNSAVAVETDTTGVSVRRNTGTVTNLNLDTSAGVTQATLATDDGDLTLTNTVNGEWVAIQGTTTGGTPTYLFQGNADSYSLMRYAGELKVRTAANGILVYGENSVEPYNAFIGLYDAGGSQIGRIGFVSSLTEFRVQHFADGRPMVFVANNDSSSAVTLFYADPDGAFTANYAGSVKFFTSNTGAQVNGNLVINTATPSSDSHAARKDYVDDSVAALEPVASSYGPTGYKVDADGFTRQWGTTIDTFSTSINVSFPRAFSSAYSVMLTEKQSTGPSLEHRHAVTSLSTSGFTITKPSDYTMSYYWEATGIS